MTETTTFLQIMGALILAFGYAAYRMYVKPYPAEQTLESTSVPFNHVLTEEIETTTPLPNPSETPISAQIRLYNLAYESLGKYLTLNDSIRPEVGCAQAVSWILLNAGYPIARNGISTVANLTKWMLRQGFVEEKKYGVGYVITGRNATTAHIGICGKTWIMSNTSFSEPKKGLVAGQFQANYSKKNWTKSFPQTRFFRPV